MILFGKEPVGIDSFGAGMPGDMFAQSRPLSIGSYISGSALNMCLCVGETSMASSRNIVDGFAPIIACGIVRSKSGHFLLNAPPDKPAVDGIESFHPFLSVDLTGIEKHSDKAAILREPLLGLVGYDSLGGKFASIEPSRAARGVRAHAQKVAVFLDTMPIGKIVELQETPYRSRRDMPAVNAAVGHVEPSRTTRIAQFALEVLGR